MRAQVVVRDAGVGVDDLGRAVGMLGVDLRRHQHRLVAEGAGVEDRRDLADDPLVEQALGPLHQLVHVELGGARDQLVGLGSERKARLQQVHQPPVGGVEGDRGASPASTDLRLRLLDGAGAERRSTQPSRRFLGEVGDHDVGAGAADRRQGLERASRARRSSRSAPPPSGSSTRPRPGRRRAGGRTASRTARITSR